MPRKKKPQKRVAKKPQPLPRSVKALLGYLSGSDVKIGSSAPQRAVVAPQALLSQQQPQFQQPIQFIPREKPVGQTIGASPLQKIIPPRPQIPYMPTPAAPAPAPAPAPPVASKQLASSIEAQEKQIALIGQRMGQLIEGTEKLTSRSMNFENRLIASNQLRFAQISDRNILDNEIRSGVRNINDPERLLTYTPGLSQTRSQSVIIPRTREAPVEIQQVPKDVVVELEPNLGSLQAVEYVKKVSSPEMTAVEKVRRGRPAKTEAQKLADKQARELLKLKEGQSAEQAFQASIARAEQKEASKRPSTTPRKKVDVPTGVDPSTQVSVMARGGMASPELRGKSLEQLFESIGSGK